MLQGCQIFKTNKKVNCLTIMSVPHSKIFFMAADMFCIHIGSIGYLCNVPPLAFWWWTSWNSVSKHIRKDMCELQEMRRARKQNWAAVQNSMQDASENRKMIAKMRIDGNITWGKKKKKKHARDQTKGDRHND